jgi:D-alanyl-lipoteichoic acid acyltransferase DltB (MBOAT superfamily)
MFFNSVEFVIFLPVVFCLYWFVVGKNLRIQNILLLIASYFFYGWWDWRFLSLIIFSSFVDYLVGIQLGATSNKGKRAKLLLLVSIFVNIGFLAFFKYFNFFAESFYQAYTFFGHSISDPILLNIILPVGISFYTFQTLSYSIDIYRGKLEPTTDIIAFFSFVSFFPQLVAGPIERATNLLPQFHKKRIFKYDDALLVPS